MNVSSYDSMDHNFFEKLLEEDEEQMLAEIIEQASKDQDYFANIYPDLKKVWGIVYIFDAIFCFLLAKMAWFERSGEAGNYRTLVNQLMSFNIDQSCLYFLIPVTFDTLRVFVGPLPRFMCQLSVFVKNLVTYNVGQICVMMTATKLAFLCYYKSIPVMDDNFLANFLYMIINLISFLTVAARFYLPGRTTLNELICTGCFYEEWRFEPKPIPTDTWVQIGCFLLHFILSIPIWIAKRKMNSKEPTAKGVTLGSFLSSWIMLFLMFIGATSYMKMNSLHPSELNEFPNNLIVFNVHLFAPFLLAITVTVSLLVKNKALRRSMGFDKVEPIYTTKN